MATQSLLLRTDPATAANSLKLTAIASQRLDIDANRIAGVRVRRRSIDARQRKVVIDLTLDVFIDALPQSTSLCAPQSFPTLPANAPAAIVVGAGPAGLFAALRLIQLGIKPIILERGKDVDSRRRDLAAISRQGTVEPDSNYCFGEGGAGAYSDGKLYTRSKKRGPVDVVLNILCQHGADEDILVDAHPHIGTDRLPVIIKAMRTTIERCGGEVRFNTRVDSLITADDRVTGVTAGSSHIAGPVILATGHSATDIYETLIAQGIAAEPKGIAVGVRVEHPQQLIDSIMYHNPAGRGKFLPPAEYSMLTRVGNRAVYSFCMCPGGFIIPAASAPGELVVNGMSPSNRGTRWANSGMVVEILPEDIPQDADGSDPKLKVLRFRSEIEHAFFNDGPDGTQNAPAQRLPDFIAGKPSASLPPTSYAPGIHPARLDLLLPQPVASRLRKGFDEFGKRYRGYITPQATVIGCETRTSAPVRIVRDPQTLRSVSHTGLYPCGEGAGYAGGIVSAAIDGMRCAEALAQSLTHNDQ